MSNGMTMTLEAIFHRVIKRKFGKTEQGRIMGALREAMAEIPSQEPDAYQMRMRTSRKESQWTDWIECGKDQAEAIRAAEYPNAHGIIREVRELFTVRPGETPSLPVALAQLEVSEHTRAVLRKCLAGAEADIDKLRAELEKVKANSKQLAELDDAFIKDQSKKLRAATAQLAERDALLREVRQSCHPTHADKIDAMLSTSAEPSAPKCDTCKGYGVIGWQTGQTPETFDQGEAPCEDCNGTGHACIQGMPVPGTCTTCKGAGHVPDGEITGAGGVEFENGPVECIKDCPDCKNHDQVTDVSDLGAGADCALCGDTGTIITDDTQKEYVTGPCPACKSETAGEAVAGLIAGRTE